MTAIWDRLGWEAHTLADGERAWDEKRAQKVVDCMRAVYLSIKDRPEYQDVKVLYLGIGSGAQDPPRLLDILRDALGMKLSKDQMGDLHAAVQALHDFDHRDLPVKDVKSDFGGKTFGHHTETVIVRKRANREYAKVLTNVCYDDYWERPEATIK